MCPCPWHEGTSTALSFLTSTLDRDEWSTSRSGCCTPVKESPVSTEWEAELAIQRRKKNLVPLSGFEHRIVKPEEVGITTGPSQLHIQTPSLQQAANKSVTSNCHSAASLNWTSTHLAMFRPVRRRNCSPIYQSRCSWTRIFGTKTLRDHPFQYNCVDLSPLVMVANDPPPGLPLRKQSVKSCRGWLRASCLWYVTFLQSLYTVHFVLQQCVCVLYKIRTYVYPLQSSRYFTFYYWSFVSSWNQTGVLYWTGDSDVRHGFIIPN